DLEKAGRIEQALPAARLELAPQRERPLEQRHVVRVLEIGPPDYPGLPVRAAPIVSTGEPIQAQHPGAAQRQVVQGGASDSARPDHDHVRHASWDYPPVRLAGPGPVCRDLLLIPIRSMMEAAGVAGAQERGNRRFTSPNGIAAARPWNVPCAAIS